MRRNYKLFLFYMSIPALITSSPAKITPLPVDKFLNRPTPRVAKSIPTNQPLCYFVSFSTVLVTPLSNSPEC